jgi:hypothetical protein
MPRRISFSLTTPQFRARTKDVTRRRGWKNLKPGDVLIAVEKAMGLKKGEKHVVLGRIEVVSNTTEPLSAIEDYPADETAREGFPELTSCEFVAMFCRGMGCKASEEIQRVEYRYL